ncbi:MAG: FKBP-type peptidyl-prolyl cis-trans isomerase [Bacteroidetes bacterium]|nr:FKBP-type peptidyl-prolyl cis-trans isomerase [Bacteroidota bacterium]
MRKGILAVVVLITILLVLFTGCTANDEAGEIVAQDSLAAPETLIERVSYSLGYLMSDSYKSQDVELDSRYFALAMEAVFGDGEALYSAEEMDQIMMEYQEVLMAEQAELTAASAGVNLEKAESFLAENKDREGIITTESGLQYEVIVAGEGAKPTSEDEVTVHYSGTLLNGTVFDSSYQRGTPATFPLNAVIPGWTEGVQLMSVGSSYRFYIHPDLGYGEIGAGELIGPNEMLVFDVELISITGQ